MPTGSVLLAGSVLLGSKVEHCLVAPTNMMSMVEVLVMNRVPFIPNTLKKTQETPPIYDQYQKLRFLCVKHPSTFKGQK